MATDVVRLGRDSEGVTTDSGIRDMSVTLSRELPIISWTDTKFVMIRISGPLPPDPRTSHPSASLYAIVQEQTGSDPRHASDVEWQNGMWLSLCTRKISIILSYWNAKVVTHWKSRWLAQAERHSDRFILNIALECGVGDTNVSFYRHLVHVKNSVISGIYRGKEPFANEWFSATQNGLLNGPVEVINLYRAVINLLRTEAPTFLYAWTNIQGLADVTTVGARKALLQKATAIDSFKRRHEADEPLQARGNTSANGVSTTNSGKTRTEAFRCIVDKLIEMGIVSERQWAQKDPMSYIDMMKTAVSEKRAKRALRVAKQCVLSRRKALDYIACPPLDRSEEITDNPVFSMLICQGFDPREVGSILLMWLGSRLYTYNTLWLYGPASIQKDVFVDALINNIPSYSVLTGSVTQKDIEKCMDVMAIWWKDAKPVHRSRDVLSCILSGTSVSMIVRDQLVNVHATPCIITGDTSLMGTDDSQDDFHKVHSSIIRLSFTKQWNMHIKPSHVAKFLSWCKPLLDASDITSLTQRGEDGVTEAKRYSVLELNEGIKRYV